MRRRNLISTIGAGIVTFSGCTESSGGDNQSNGDTSTGSGTETINLRVGSFIKKDALAVSKYTYPVWVEKVNSKLDDYKLEPEFLGSGSVGGPGELYDLTAEGTLDMAHDLPAYQGGRMPLNTVGSVAGGYTPSVQGQTKACLAMHEMATPGGESEILYNEFSNLGVRPLWTIVTPPAQLALKRRVSDIEELENTRVGVNGSQRDAAEAIGMSPENIAGADLTSALQSGIIDGMFSPIVGVLSNAWYEGVNYCTTNLHLGSVNSSWVMNPDTFEEYPSQVKDAMIKAANEMVAEYPTNLENGMQELIDNSDHVVTESPVDKDSQYLLYETEAKEAINERLEPVKTKWIESKDNQNKARKVMEEYQSLQKSL
jgi:TRAP-type C4-dicarboxylate transport system substrate-binding protein